MIDYSRGFREGLENTHLDVKNVIRHDMLDETMHQPPGMIDQFAHNLLYKK